MVYVPVSVYVRMFELMCTFGSLQVNTNSAISSAPPVALNRIDSLNSYR